jgi:hypothetical protein
MNILNPKVWNSKTSKLWNVSGLKLFVWNVKYVLCLVEEFDEMAQYHTIKKKNIS